MTALWLKYGSWIKYLVVPAAVCLFVYGILQYAKHVGYTAGYAASDKLRADAVAAAQAENAAITAGYIKSAQQWENKYVVLQVDAHDAAVRYADSLRAYQARLRAATAVAATPSQPDVAPGSAAEDSRFADLSGAVIEACLRDDAKLTALQGWITDTH